MKRTKNFSGRADKLPSVGVDEISGNAGAQTTCAVCGKPFEPGQRLSMAPLSETAVEGGTMYVCHPSHRSCLVSPAEEIVQRVRVDVRDEDSMATLRVWGQGDVLGMLIVRREDAETIAKRLMAIEPAPTKEERRSVPPAAANDWRPALQEALMTLARPGTPVDEMVKAAREATKEQARTLAMQALHEWSCRSLDAIQARNEIALRETSENARKAAVALTRILADIQSTTN